MSVVKFKRKAEAECLKAIGLIKVGSKYESLHQDVYTSCSNPQELLKAIRPDSERFNEIPLPTADDWLANHHEEGQTFIQFTRTLRKRPTTLENTIYVQPLEFFEEGVPCSILDLLSTFASVFFGMAVKILKNSTWTKKISHRQNSYTGQTQVHAGEILKELTKLQPRNAFCVTAITMCDLYPRDEWNFVFGLARLGDGVGVYSLARYTPGFFESGKTSNMNHLSREEQAALLKRSCLLMTHEICHIFGLKHCI